MGDDLTWRQSLVDGRPARYAVGAGLALWSALHTESVGSALQTSPSLRPVVLLNVHFGI